ncbi:hypothetical protein B0H11DRAFT_1713230, partial [Mycena galericulata]
PTHLEKFFSSYPKYEYDPSGPASQQFQQLREVYNWGRGRGRDSALGDAAYKGYSMALVLTFTQLYGDDASDLGNWQRLCRTVGINPVPDSILECRRVIEDAHVNLMDLLDTHTTGEPVRRFATEMELSEYTQDTGKKFPRKWIPKGCLLYFLLRRIEDPPAENLMRRGNRWVERDSQISAEA